MSTGTTWPVEKGKVTTLTDFAHLYFRDREGDVPPKVREVSDRYDRWTAKAESDLARLKAMTPEEIERACAEDNASHYSSWEESSALVKLENERLQAMLDQVEAWDAPEVLARLKEMMLRDLRESMHTERQAPTPELPGDWHALRIEIAQRDIEVQRENKASEEASVAQRNAWVSTFFSEFPDTPDRSRA